ncbi:MAG: 3-oxoacyl-[acyl-carrier-protein] reductase [Rickettsiales bacterium]|jgi:3-oxoacyl-[acyl-carrier protein] reductase|nr:3-oxoacyl-[acyl-carrier-protein] reductase [Rickettsiales bacterium]
MFDLTGKVALITGATGGIGEGIARAMHAAGAAVVLTGRKLDKLESLKAELGDRAFLIAADLSDAAAAEKLVADSIAAAGRLDILVNNAGMTKDGLMMRMKDEDFFEVLNVNLGSAFRLSKAAVSPMMKNRFGRIINITSVVGTMGNAGQANYAASKGAITAMTKSVATEVASRGITANCIAPGFIKTAMTDVLSDDIKNLMLKQIPAGRFGEPADIAAAAVFLASGEASYITGQTIHVNGGMLRV